jgi:hypothetical protein
VFELLDRQRITEDSQQWPVQLVDLITLAISDQALVNMIPQLQGSFWSDEFNHFKKDPFPISQRENVQIYNIVARMWRLYKTGIGLPTGFMGSHTVTHNYSVYTLHSQFTRVLAESSYNYNWLSQLSLFRAQDLLQTQLALTGHQLTLLDSSPQLTVN